MRSGSQENPKDRQVATENLLGLNTRQNCNAPAKNDDGSTSEEEQAVRQAELASKADVFDDVGVANTPQQSQARLRTDRVALGRRFARFTYSRRYSHK